jgi:hypothetical protein
MFPRQQLYFNNGTVFSTPCADKDSQLFPFGRSVSEWVSEWVVELLRSVAVAEARGQFLYEEEEERLPLETAAKQR